MTNITAKEFKVLEVFAKAGMECNGTDNAEDLKADNMTWTRPSEVRKALRIKAEAVGALFTSLQSKGLIVDSGERMVDGVSKPAKTNTDWYLSDEGIDAYFAGQEPTEVKPVEVEAEAPAEEESEEDAAAAQFAVLFQNFGGNLPRGICKALRQIARIYRREGIARKDFIAHAVAADLNPGNASAEWQASANRED